MPRKPGNKPNPKKENKKDIKDKLIEEKLGLKKEDVILEGGKVEEFKLDSDSDSDVESIKEINPDDEEPETIDEDAGDEEENEDNLGDDVEIDDEDHEEGDEEELDDCMYSDAEEEEDYEEVEEEGEEEAYNVPVEDRKTKPYITNNERVLLISKRATMLANDSKPMLKNAIHLPPEQIAKEEYLHKKIPLKVIRILPDNTKEVWSLEEFENIE